MTDGAAPVLLVGRHVPGFDGLATALAALGTPVLRVDAGTREEARAAFAGVSAAVLSIGPANRGAARPLLDWSGDDWRRCADEAQFALLEVLQGLHDALAGGNCAVVLIGPTLGLTGAALHAALATASEGQRGLMKALARQWGPQVRFAWLAVPPSLLFPDIAADDLPEQCELGDYVPPLGRRPGWDEVARIARALASGAAAGITGQTIVVDGGEWMLP